MNSKGTLYLLCTTFFFIGLLVGGYAILGFRGVGKTYGETILVDTHDLTLNEVLYVCAHEYAHTTINTREEDVVDGFMGRLVDKPITLEYPIR